MQSSRRPTASRLRCERVDYPSRQSWKPGLTAIVALGLAACSGVSKDAGYSTVDRSIYERDRVVVNSSVATSPDTTIRRLLEKPLTVDDAVHIAMTNNRALQAEFQEVGIARGDLVEAGVLPNPNLDAMVRWKDDESSTNPEIALTWDVMEVVRASKRKGVANAELDRVAFDVSDRAAAFAAQVRISYFDFQAANQVRRMRVEVVRAAKASAELANRQRTAGNINELERAVEQSVYQDARLDLLRADAAATRARTALASAMGLFAADTTWSVVAELPQIPDVDPPADTLETLALAGRFDLLAARKQVEVGRRDVSYHKSYRLPSFEIGVDAERDFGDDTWAYGPVVMMALPLFDRGQGGIERANARLRQAEYRATATETEVRNDVRAAWEDMRAARAVVETYRDDVIPTRERVVAESQKQYNFMLVGPMALLQAKRDEIDAYREYIEAVRDYWSVRAELERAVASRIEEID